MSLKSLVKGTVHKLRHDYHSLAHSFGDSELLQGLQQVGVQEGDTLLVHSSLDAFVGYQGKPTDVIAVLQRVVGEGGTLLMPTIPFIGAAVDYARSGDVFDVKRSPARVGMLPELFRRMPGVVRSLHPTHSVAAWGRNAQEVVDGHECEETPCGPGSPYGKLVVLDGKSLFLGVGLGSMTFFHAIEAWLEPRMPMSPFTSEWFDLKCRDARGVLHDVRTRLYEPAVSRRRRLGRLEAELKRAGAWNETMVVRLNVLAVGARDALAAAERLAHRGEFCYEQ